MTDATAAPHPATNPPSEDPEQFLARWVRALESGLNLPAGTVQVMPVLDLTRDCARNVARPAGPVASYAAGYAQALADVAAGRTAPVGGSDAAIQQAVTLALAWSPDDADAPEAP